MLYRRGWKSDRTFTHSTRIPDVRAIVDLWYTIRKHLESLKPIVDNGTIPFGGASLDEPVKEGEGPKINGSVMIVCADSKEDVMKVVESDVYADSKVWDMSKVCERMPLRTCAGC